MELTYEDLPVITKNIQIKTVNLQTEDNKNNKIKFEGYVRKCELTGRTSISLRNLSDTDRRASCGHSMNQSMEVQLTTAGNLRERTRSVEPTGEKHRMTLISRRTLLMKNFQQFSRVSCIPEPFTCKYHQRESTSGSCINPTLKSLSQRAVSTSARQTAFL